MILGNSSNRRFTSALGGPTTNKPPSAYLKASPTGVIPTSSIIRASHTVTQMAPAPRPLPLMAPLPNPFFNLQRTQNPVPTPFNVIQPHITNPLANSTYLSNPFTQTNTERHTHTNTKNQNPRSTRQGKKASKNEKRHPDARFTG
jgi:hypothetical protein